MISQAQFIFWKAQAQEKIMDKAAPVLEPLEVCPWFAEKFQFHLLKLSGTENKVSRSNLIAERFANLANAERQFAAGRSLNVAEVDENALRGFGA